ncbi:MAG TPA: lipid A biosynthesis lauroyl acyltransferase [Candidatus Cybelea sp.]|nr:lipid A biosynthesis lauroyl acyltransferase [Candidatus Cybelea sp.]
MARPMRLKYRIEAAFVRVAYVLFRALPVEAASAIGGAIARTIGPLLPISREAETRLRRAIPDIGAAEAEKIVRRMWDNLGRVAGEYAHLDRIDRDDGGKRVEVVGAEHIDALRDDGIGGIFFSGHFGNWEILPIAASRRGVPLTLVYREANNPAVEEIIQRARAGALSRHLAKGAAGARDLVSAIANGEHLGMLLDQKMNDGIPVPFFGRDAMTAPAMARLALRYGCPVVPARVERTGPARFRLTVYPPMHFDDTGDARADTLAAMTRVNAIMEGWIRERPDHWLWLHRRWPD